MKKEFSLHYGEKKQVFEAKDGAVYELENGVTIEVICRDYTEFDACEWVVYFENKSDKNSQIISRICDCDTLLPLALPPAPKAGYRLQAGDVCVITMNGMVNGNYYWDNDRVSSTEYNFYREYLDRSEGGKKLFSNTFGRSSEGMMPFFDITANGEGYIAAIGWTGDWKAEFSKTETGVTMKSGLKETDFYLKPGEKIRTSSTLIMPYTALENKYNKFRSLIKSHFSHKANTDAARDGLMACELWGGLTSEEMKKRIKEFAKYDIRFEDVWIDAGWYGHSNKCDDAFTGDWSTQTGEWEVNTRVHPDKLYDVAECARSVGMNMMLWFEPERASQGTRITKEKSDWFLKIPYSGNQILYYGNKEAVEYVYNLLSSYVDNLKLSCYRQDFNTELTEFFKQNDTDGRRGITEIKHIMGMYELWDRLLEKYPGLIIDNCSSGGRRIDIETLKRSIPFFRSDYQCNFNENPEVLQVHNANISCYLPYNGCTTKTKNDIYAARSSFSSSWGGAFYNAIFQSMTEEDFKWAKKITDEYRAIRKYFSMDFYNHGSSVFDETAWTIWQYHDSETQSGIVMAFRRCESPFEQVSVKLKGFTEGQSCLFKNFNNGDTFEGTDLLTVHLPEKRSSIILKYSIA